MKSRAEVKADILKALGNPEAGVFLDHIDVIVDAVVGKEAKAPDQSGSVRGANIVADTPTKETRTIEASEKR